MSYPTRIRSATVLSATLAAAVALAACDVASSPPLAPPDAEFAISDAVHQNGNEHFFFLPPLVPNPQTSGTFDAGLAPTIRITDGGGFDITLNADLDNSNSHYHQNWHTGDYDLDPAQTYRITVIADGQELGFADVDVVSSGKELRNVDTGEYIALKDGRTLPILFRIEEGALAADPGLFEVTTEVPLDPFTGDPLATGSLRFTVCDPTGPCPHDGATLPINDTGSFPIDAGIWEYAVEYLPDGLFDTCGIDPDNADPIAGTETVDPGETVAITVSVVCDDF